MESAVGPEIGQNHRTRTKQNINKSLFLSVWMPLLLIDGADDILNEETQIRKEFALYYV